MTEPATLTERTPPHDHNAEQCVIGAMLLSADAIADVADTLETRDFHNTVNAEIFDAICHNFTAGQPADPVTIAAHLQARGRLGRIPGGATYLHDCTAAVPMAVNAAWYARIVTRTATRRRLIEAGTRIAHLGYATDGPDDDITDRAGQLLYQAVSDHLTSDLIQIGDLIPDAFEAIEAAGRQVGLRGLPTGLIDLDRMTHGLQANQLVVIAARPGVGKTIMGTDLARAVAIKHKQPVIFFSLEMDRRELMNRLLAAHTGVRLDRIQTGQLSEIEWTALSEAAGEIAEAPLYIDDKAGVTLMEIRAKARRLAQRNALGMIVVDYLQLIGGASRRSESREREVAEISRSLKLLAKELAVPVVVLAQLNRSVESRVDKVPVLSDLRESGAVEQDADIVIMLHRDEYYTKSASKRPGEIDIHLAKNRNGQTGTVIACAQMPQQRFVDMSVEAENPRIYR